MVDASKWSWVRTSGEKDFRWRGEQVSRLEAFSDVVFALTLTFVAVSDVAIDGAHQIVDRLPRHVLTLGVTYAILAMIWHAHYLFFRRYGLRNFYCALLNFFLLFLVLVYAYPLKLIFSELIGAIFFGDGFRVSGMAKDEALYRSSRAMMFYSAGFGAIYLTLVMLYRHAWKLRDALQLNEIEKFTTRTYIRMNSIILGFAVCSVSIAWISPAHTPWAGFVYFFIGPVLGVYGAYRGWAQERLVKASGT